MVVCKDAADNVISGCRLGPVDKFSSWLGRLPGTIHNSQGVTAHALDNVMFDDLGLPSMIDYHSIIKQQCTTVVSGQPA